MEGVPAANDSVSDPVERADTMDSPHNETTSENELTDANDALDASLPPEEPPAEILPHRVVEAILFSADSPIPAAKIALLLGVGDARDVRKSVDRLNDEYASLGLSFRIQEVAGGFQMLTLPAYNTWLKKLLRARQETRLSPAALETLAILAYKQPCTRAVVEAIRGVAAGELIGRLRELNLVKIVGRAEDLGRPLLYGTTKRFLEIFGLPSLEELPQVEALAGGNAVGTVRESATMPTVALANGPVTDQPPAAQTFDLPLPEAGASPLTEPPPEAHESDDAAEPAVDEHVSATQ